MVSNVFPLNSIPVNRIGGGDLNCGLCGQEVEQVLHVFRDAMFLAPLPLQTNGASGWTPWQVTLPRTLCEMYCSIQVGRLVIWKF